MKVLFILFSNIMSAGVRIFVCLFLIHRFLSAKKPDRKHICFIFAGIAVISAALSLLQCSPQCSIILEILWIAVCASHFQGADTRMSLFIGIFYEIAVSFWLFLAAAWAGVLFHAPSFLDFNTRNGQITLWLLHILLAAFALCLNKHPNMDRKEGVRLGAMIALTGFLAVVTLSQQSILLIPNDTVYMWTILSVLLMMSVLVFDMNRQYEVEKEFALLKSHQAELLEQNYTTLNHAYSINAKLFHDFHNHIGVLQQLLTRRKFDEAIQYLEELNAPVREMAHSIWTGDETLDYLINSKAQAAESNGIQYQAQVEFPRHTNLGSADLCAILGNLLDNALEAAEQVAEKEGRFIRLTIRRINQMLVIKVENSFSSHPVVKDGILKTSKEENGLHGWGLKSAQTAAEKYDGTVQTSYAGNTFRAVATLSFQSVSIE